MSRAQVLRKVRPYTQYLSFGVHFIGARKRNCSVGRHNSLVTGTIIRSWKLCSAFFVFGEARFQIDTMSQCFHQWWCAAMFPSAELQPDVGYFLVVQKYTGTFPHAKRVGGKRNWKRRLKVVLYSCSCSIAERYVRWTSPRCTLYSAPRNRINI